MNTTPKPADTEKSQTFLYARLPKDLYGRIRAAAEADGRTVANWVKVTLMKVLDGEEGEGRKTT